MHNTDLKSLFIIICALMLFQCSSAKLTMKDGGEFKGTITGGDKTHLSIISNDDDKLKLARDSIASISHPGIEEILSGSGLILMGLFVIGLEKLADQVDNSEPDWDLNNNEAKMDLLVITYFLSGGA